MKETRSKGLKTGDNHLIVMGLVNGERESRIVMKAIKKAARKLRKLNGDKTTFESYITFKEGRSEDV